MALRLSEEEFAALQRRRGLTRCAAPSPSGVSVADMDEERSREMTRQNYYAQLAGMGYDPSGNPLPVKETKKRNKYGNRRVEIDGIKFDSQHEANVYQELMLRVRAGELKTVCRQVKFDLPGGIVYVADFVTIRPDMTVEGVYDAKSEATKQNRVYINKKKQVKACWGIDIQEV